MNRQSRMHPYAAALFGGAVGLVYVAFDLFAEAKIGHGTLHGPLAGIHDAIDHTVPVLVGAFLAVCVHSIRMHARLGAAEEAASRADALRNRLERVERDQAVWVLAAAVLHEVNNPLHALGLLLDEIDAGEADGSRRGDLIARARVQADRALSRLRALRTMHRVREPELGPVALAPVVASLADAVGPLVAVEGLVVRVDCDPDVRARADAEYVQAILENLVDNSFHALRSRGHGSVAIELRRRAHHAVIRVHDDGPALDPGVRASLFEPLGTTKDGGLGLGLPIARALARAMHGDLVFEDAPGKAFRLDLPLAEEAAP